ncbi:MAG: universal stress protein [Myxococcota bacterium]
MTDAVNKILVATDFSDGSMVALRFAHTLAQSVGATLSIAHIWDYRTVYPSAIATSGPPEVAVLSVKKEASARLDAFLDRVKAEHIPIDRSHIAPGHPAEELARLCQSHHYDMIVAGTAGRRGAARFFLGSVAEQIIRQSPVPVVTVRTPAD